MDEDEQYDMGSIMARRFSDSIELYQDNDIIVVKNYELQTLSDLLLKLLAAQNAAAPHGADAEGGTG